LDALTVTAVMITVVYTFYNLYVQADLKERVPGDLSDEERKGLAREDLDQFDSFLRNLMMHGLVGTAIGGVCTMVGEPQNLIIAQKMGWSFKDFFLQMIHVTGPIVVFGFATTFLVEKFNIAGYGAKLPIRVKLILAKAAKEAEGEMDSSKRYQLWVQGIAALWVIAGLALHLAEVGLIGLSVIVFLAIFTGKSSEHVIGQSFQEATPFASLLIVFFVIVGMVEHTGLFQPIIQAALAQEGDSQTYFFFFASGLLSAISDNVFVATIYIQQAIESIQDRVQLEKIAVAINIGTNIPSVATPNGQAAFLFLLTNVLASKIHLSYFRMMKMALPYLIVLTTVAAIFITYNWI
jgi:Na+:H+ antiporter, NhaB family